MNYNFSIESNVNDLFKDVYKSNESYENQNRLEIKMATERLNELEVAMLMYETNTSAKLRMLSKINKEYGICSRGIENYCKIQSLEVDDTNNNQNGSSNGVQNNNNNSNQNNGNDQNKKNKLVEFIKKIWETIQQIWSKIFDWIMNLINKFRYNNKVFEQTINQINNASPEDLNKVVGDLKAVQFNQKNIIEVGKHPIDNLNNFIGTYQNMCSVFDNAIASAGTNPKDYTRLKDFAAKLYDFVKVIPDIGNACPKLESDGSDSLKQYYTSLKTFSGNSLNYNKNIQSFNTYFGKSKTLNDKMTVENITNSTDPKAIIELIKRENESIEKFNVNLKQINEKFNKSSKSVRGLLTKFIGFSGDSQSSTELNNQIQALVAIGKTITQINGIFTGIVANDIKSVNLIKGKLIESVKKNVSNKANKDQNNNNDENK